MLLRFLSKGVTCAVVTLLFLNLGFAQVPQSVPSKVPIKKPAAVGPKVTQIDIEGLRALLKPKGKPLLINFWATWCDPCREEFPDLVKLDAAYRSRIDFVTVSLDDLAEIDGDVPKFLNEVKATMPAYLLKTTDDDAAIAIISKNWKGNLPLTILYNPAGGVAYERNGIIKYDTATAEIDKVLAAPAPIADKIVSLVPPSDMEY